MDIQWELSVSVVDIVYVLYEKSVNGLGSEILTQYDLIEVNYNDIVL